MAGAPSHVQPASISNRGTSDGCGQPAYFACWLPDVGSLIRTVTGFVGYSLIRTDDGGISVTVCQDRAGTEESVQKVKDWIGQNVSNIGASASKVSERPVILQLK